MELFVSSNNVFLFFFNDLVTNAFIFCKWTRILAHRNY